MAQSTASAILKDDADGLGVNEGKMTEDFSQAASQLVDKISQLKQTTFVGPTNPIFDELFALEKKCRQANDGASGSRLCCFYLQNLEDLRKAGEEKDGVPVISVGFLCDQLVVLCKKRGQLKRVISDIVKLAVTWLTEMKKEDKVEVIETLKRITEGKIFVEVERARLVLMLAEMKEAEGKIDEAATILQEVQVETFGAMERREKTEYILKQMSLVLRRGDFIRCQIISKKISTKLLDNDEDLQDLKIRYYSLMIVYYLHEGMILDCCKAYQSIFITPSVQQKEDQWIKSLQCYILFLLLAPFDDEAKQLAQTVQTMEAKKLKEIPVFAQLLKDMTTVVLLSWPLPYEATLKAHEVFQNTPHEGGEGRWALLRRRVIQHNIRVIATYYSCIEMDRVASLLDITKDEAESEISELVCSNFIEAKIDRPAGTVEFGKRKGTFDRLNSWAADVTSLLDRVDLCSHLIQKERMVHAARAKNAALLARNAS
ncbi:26s proteasome subunit p55, putative [Toxoplasma gondii ME49]|uniref:26S proteasome non-ATPase regulatory subunit,putative n=18 Tax=Toxoplasma gondii TaxID=5811 RepID=B9PKI5_TOXGV|nr:26s proteasome subunit p55, putative [Toxoplasma gondii ME49]EPR62728.1 putative 26s proteasome subunit p55 [Toxoplasma gondii GT1]ESS32105.1 putative 26s proteasome subunit p55 [Toxoplasma gondii VEG]KAF4641131.1 putative 26s proteasome subunit p55 [Toxoplasma gondii]KYF41468.1 putative 26s proteasome subunit p55 [Toxoplasma gondii ARI]EPT29555.1 26s proteasome subunit p55, putative [Toxoplasma gondii ME49]|eukprot:XP_002365264.1 26s proteasome subunit p55, putative [Toxoplasma gondii ME49]